MDVPIQNPGGNGLNVFMDQRTERLHAQNPAAVKKDAIFIWIPKVAGSSISNLLEDNGARILKRESLQSQNRNTGVTNFGHCKITDLLKNGIITQEYYDRALKFAFVRNPWDRFVSLYNYYRRVSRKGRSVIERNISFTEFCLRIFLSRLPKVGYQIPPVGPWHVRKFSQCNPQLDWITDDDGKIFVDFVGRYESLQDHFGILRSILKIGGELPQDNKADKSQHYRNQYNIVTKKIVRDIYKKDVLAFGYRF